MIPARLKIARSGVSRSIGVSLLFSIKKDKRHLLWTLSARFSSTRIGSLGAALAAEAINTSIIGISAFGYLIVSSDQMSKFRQLMITTPIPRAVNVLTCRRPGARL